MSERCDGMAEVSSAKNEAGLAFLKPRFYIVITITVGTICIVL